MPVCVLQLVPTFLEADQMTFLDEGWSNIFPMKEITPKQVLAVRCPTCGAAPGVRCELGTATYGATSSPPIDCSREIRLVTIMGEMRQGIHLALTSGIRVKAIYEVERPSEGISTVR